MKTTAQLQADIGHLRTAVDALRDMGVEILSAYVTGYRTPEIHVTYSPALADFPGRYVRTRMDTCTHYGLPYLDCELIWLAPSPVPGQALMAFAPLNHERTSHA